jgi:hypothetical protein
MAGSLLVGCSPTPPSPPAAISSGAELLARSLHLPSIDPELQGCPVTSGHPANDFEPPNSAFAIGPGPVYPVMAAQSSATGTIPFYPIADGWHYAKVPFFSRPDYHGPVVMRGAQIDGTNLLRFDGHPALTSSIDLTSADAAFHPVAGWRGWPTGILVRSRGCYALQIDGSSFSVVVVFLALVDMLPSPTAHPASGGCGSTTVYVGSPPEWLVDAAGGAGAPSTLPYFSSSPGLIGGFIFGNPLRVGHPNSPTNKILWAVATARKGAPLNIIGHPQVAAIPVVTFSFPDNSSPGEIYPSIVDVPSPGCWAFTLSWGTAQAQVQLAYVP